MGTTYDEIYTYFITNTQIEELELPSTDNGKYNLIANGVLMYNNKFRANITTDNITETVSIILNNDQLMIIGQYMRMTTLRNMLSYKNSKFAIFTKEIGVRFINSQVSSLSTEIKECERQVDLIIFNADEDDLMEEV